VVVLMSFLFWVISRLVVWSSPLGSQCNVDVTYNSYRYELYNQCNTSFMQAIMGLLQSSTSRWNEPPRDETLLQPHHVYRLRAFALRDRLYNAVLGVNVVISVGNLVLVKGRQHH